MWSGWTQRLNPAAAHDDVVQRSAHRIEVCPPARTFERSAWQDGLREGLREGLRDWLATGWQVSTLAAPLRELRQASPQTSPVLAVRREFAESIADIGSAGADTLATRIQQARSLRELWHLRAEVYTLVSQAFDEAQAQARLARLNRHFPTRSPTRSGQRSPRSAFGGL